MSNLYTCKAYEHVQFSSLSDRTAIIGPPGTGKTYQMEQLIKSAGVKYVYLTYSRSMAQEARKRIVEDPDHVGTFHSILARHLGMSSFLKREDIEFFCSHFGLSMPTFFTNEEFIGNDDFSQFMQKYDYARNTLKTIENDAKLNLKYLAKEYEKYKNGIGKYDYTDILVRASQRPLPYYDAVFVDEAQDLTPLMWQIVDRWPTKRLILGGDDDQCIPEGAMISVPSGKVPIERLRIGDEVLTGTGYGFVGISRVTNKMRIVGKHRHITFTVESGKMLTVTDNHLLFSTIRGNVRTTNGTYFIYLMRKEGSWRIGQTRMPIQRTRFERGVDALYIIKSVNTIDEAIFYEEFYSLKYGIPTQTFVKHEDGQIIYGPVLDALCKKLDVHEKANKLLDDLLIDVRYPMYIPSNSRKNGAGGTLLLNMLNVKSRPKVHNIARRYSTFHELIYEKQVAGNYQRQRWKGSIDELERKAKEIGYPARIKARIAEGVHGEVAWVMPASNVMEGMYLPVFDKENNVLRYEKIIKREENINDDAVYDLEIDRTANFIVDDFAVHNCIFSFKGVYADDFIQQARKSDIIELTVSRRFGDNVRVMAEKVTRGINRIEKHYVGIGETEIKFIGLREFLHFPGEKAILTRTNKLAQNVAQSVFVPTWPINPSHSLNNGWTARTLRLARILNSWPPSDHEDIKYLIDNLPAAILVRGVKKNINELQPNLYGFEGLFKHKPTARNVIDWLNVSDKQKALLNLYLGKDVSQIVRIDTIHAAKGMEFDNVLFVLDKPFNLEYNAEEKRIVYTGITRVKKLLAFAYMDFYRDQYRLY